MFTYPRNICKRIIGLQYPDYVVESYKKENANLFPTSIDISFSWFRYIAFYFVLCFFFIIRVYTASNN